TPRRAIAAAANPTASEYRTGRGQSGTRRRLMSVRCTGVARRDCDRIFWRDNTNNDETVKQVPPSPTKGNALQGARPPRKRAPGRRRGRGRAVASFAFRYSGLTCPTVGATVVFNRINGQAPPDHLRLPDERIRLRARGR